MQNKKLLQWIISYVISTSKFDKDTHNRHFCDVVGIRNATRSWICNRKSQNYQVPFSKTTICMDPKPKFVSAISMPAICIKPFPSPPPLPRQLIAIQWQEPVTQLLHYIPVWPKWESNRSNVHSLRLTVMTKKPKMMKRYIKCFLISNHRRRYGGSPLSIMIYLPFTEM